MTATPLNQAIKEKVSVETAAYDNLMCHALVVDLFAGGGGASTGISQAIGRDVDLAVDHNAEAMAMHAANHPGTRHVIGDVFSVDPVAATGGQPVGLLWASPDCKHFSRAKSGVQLSTKIRSLAWAVVKWAAAVRPRVIMLENVPEFATWGPLVNGKPCKKRKGQTFAQWVARLRALGYEVQWRELRACDYGVPTIRKRFFLIARRDGLPIIWPTPTHGNPDSAEVRAGILAPWRTAADCIDWSLPCPSIFLTRDEARAVGCKRPLADTTIARIKHGVQRFVLDAAKPFIVPIQTKGGAYALAVPTLVEIGYGEGKGQRPRAPGIGIPLGTVVASGTKHALVLATLAGHNADTDAPTATITANGSAYKIADIGLRMLTPRELFRAQGFPESYVIDVGCGKRFTKETQVRLCGNSVCPPVARAIVSANYQDRGKSQPSICGEVAS